MSARNSPFPDCGDFGPSSGALSRSFTLDSAGEVTTDFDFGFLCVGGFEANEIGQAIAELDGITPRRFAC